MGYIHYRRERGERERKRENNIVAIVDVVVLLTSIRMCISLLWSKYHKSM